MTDSTTNLDQLSKQSDLPSYILEYFDRVGFFFEPSIESDPVAEPSESNVSLAKHIADIRSLGFSLDQIAAILEGEIASAPVDQPQLAYGA